MATVESHYGETSAAARVLAAAAAAGITEITPQSLAPADQFHTGGIVATRELAAFAGIQPGERVLDVGSGLGGPSRILAAEFGADVTGIDLTPAFVEDATTLTVRCGLTDRVRFELGSALDMPFADGAFDVVWTQHAVMNIEDRATLYRECARVLRPGGRLVFHDILAGDGRALDFPVPWAVDADISFICTEAETKAFLAGAGLELVEWRDETEAAIAVGLPPAPPPGVIPFGLMVVLGPDLPNRIENLARAGRDGRVRVVRALYRKR